MSFSDEILSQAGVEKTNPANPNPDGKSDEGKEPNANDSKPNAGADTDDDDIDEEKVLAFLKKKKGYTGSTLDEIAKPESGKQPELTDEQKAEKVAERKRKVMMFGLETGKIKGQDEYQQYIADVNKTPREIALAQFHTERLAEDDSLTDEDIEDEFADLYFENEKEGSPKRVRAEKQLAAIKNKFIAEQYGDIEGLDSEYEQHVNTQVARTQHSNRVEKIITGLPKEVPFVVTDPTDPKKNFTYNFKISDDTLKTIRDNYTDEAHFSTFSSNAIEDAKLTEVITNSVKYRELDRIISDIAHAHASAMMKANSIGRRGDRPYREGGEGAAVIGGNGVSDKLIEQSKNS